MINEKELYKASLAKWGVAFQYTKLCEEMGELLQAASKVLLGKWNKKRLAEEVADVKIMLEQFEQAYGIEEIVTKMKKAKLLRLRKRIGKNEAYL